MFTHLPCLPPLPFRYGTQYAPGSGITISVLSNYDPAFPAAYTNAFPPGQFGRFSCSTFTINLNTVCNPYTSTYFPGST